MHNKMKIFPAISLVLAAAIVLAGAAFSIHLVIDHEDEDEDSTCILVLSVFTLTGYALSRLSAFSILKLCPIIATSNHATWPLDRPPRH